MGKVIGVQFRKDGKIYDFDSGHFVLKKGDRVIVETERGLGLGTVAQEPRKREEGLPSKRLKSIFRLATDEDLEQGAHNLRLEQEAREFCLERIGARDLPMNLSRVECLFDRSKIIFYFTAEGRVDFRELVKDLVGRLRMRVELRQIGVRNEAKMLGGLGCCGRELCCATFLNEFEPVSVKMAKEQNLALNPAKISGLCGRLMCCLTYEYPTYLACKEGLPKCGKRITTKLGDGKVIRQDVLRRKFIVQLAEGGKDVELSPEDVACPAPAQTPKEKKSRG